VMLSDFEFHHLANSKDSGFLWKQEMSSDTHIKQWNVWVFSEILSQLKKGKVKGTWMSAFTQDGEMNDFYVDIKEKGSSIVGKAWGPSG
jgi:hypothetical protein